MRSYEEIAEAVFKRRDEYEKKQKERVKMLRKITAAACVCFVIAIGFVVRYTDIIRDTGVAEPDPTLQTEETVPTEPPATKPSGGVGEGGTGRLMFEGKYDYNFYGAERRFTNYVGRDEYAEWKKSYDDSGNSMECTILAFIEYFEIPKEVFEKINNVDGSKAYSDEEVDALYSGNKLLLAEQFMNLNAMLVGDEIYPPKWFVEHSAEEIKSAGITVEMLEEKAVEWKETFGELSDFYGEVELKLDEYKSIDNS